MLALRYRLRRAEWCAVLVAVMAAAVGAAVPEGGFGPGSLELSVAVDRHVLGAGAGPIVRVGEPVVVSYRLSNQGEATVTRVRISDTLVPPSALRCPGGADGRMLRLAPLTSVSCTATIIADPDQHAGTVLAEGTVPYGRVRLRRTGRSGYVGVGGRLALAVSPQVSPAVVPQGQQATALVRYTLANTGNRPVLAVVLADPELAPQRIDCGPGTGVPALAPGAVAQCRAVVRRLPGKYRSAGQATGSDRLVTVGPDGGHLPPTQLTARATAGFAVGVLLATPPPVRPLAPVHVRVPAPAPLTVTSTAPTPVPVPGLVQVPIPTRPRQGPAPSSSLSPRTPGAAAASGGLAFGAGPRPAGGGGPGQPGGRPGPLLGAALPRAAPLLHTGHGGSPGGILRRYALIMFLLLMLPAAAAAATLGIRRRGR